MAYPLHFDEYDDLPPSSDECRTHFIDNLRATLTVLLIIQHSIVETASSSYPYFTSLPLTIFVSLTKTIVVGLFFFVSGYSASISRTTPSVFSYTRRRTDPKFVWRRTVRLLFPGIVYGALGHVLLWMLLTKSWPTFFGTGSASTEEGYSSPMVWGFARFEGPVVHILFLYVLDMAFVLLRPAKKGVIAGGFVSGAKGRAPKSKSGGSEASPRKKKKYRLIKIKSAKDWYTLVGIALGLLCLWTFAVAASGKSEKSPLRFGFNVASYDAIVPAAPFQHILAYMAGIQLYKWQTFMIVPSVYAFPAFLTALCSSISLLLFGMYTSPTLREVVHLNTPWPVHASFINGGFNYHTLFFSIWNAFTFFGVSSTLVSLFAQWEWTRRDWGPVARHSYIPVWFHMVPVVVFVKLLAADGGWSASIPLSQAGAAAPALAQESVGWRCFLVAMGSVISSWFVGLAVTGFVWFMGC